MTKIPLTHGVAQLGEDDCWTVEVDHREIHVSQRFGIGLSLRLSRLLEECPPAPFLASKLLL